MDGGESYIQDGSYMALFSNIFRGYLHSCSMIFFCSYHGFFTYAILKTKSNFPSGWEQRREERRVRDAHMGAIRSCRFRWIYAIFAFMMKDEHFDSILKSHAKTDKEGWQVMPEGIFLTFYLAHEGVSLSLSRIEAVRQEGDLLYARGLQRALFALEKKDIFVVAVEGSKSQPVRRAGFG